MDARLRVYFPFSALKDEKDDGLLRRFPKERLRGHPVVCWTARNERCYDGVERRYGAFDSVPSFWSFYERVPLASRAGYEVILGCYPQKPHFDIDIGTMDVAGDQVLQLLVDVFQNVLETKGVQLDLARDVMVYTSHGATKQSYHVVLPRHAHANNTQAKAFSDQVRALLPTEARKYVDAGVYNPLQQFRLLWSSKVEAERPKVEVLEWFHHGQRVCAEALEPLHALARSLVGWTVDCTPLPIWDVQEPSFVPRRFLTAEAEEAVALLHADPALGGNRFKAKNAGGVIALIRQAPGYCPVCACVHDRENAYLVIRDNNVYYKCHRARVDGNRGSSYIGSLPPVEP